MTEAQKIEALTDLLDNVIFYLDTTKYLIDDADKASSVVREADKFRQQIKRTAGGVTVDLVAQDTSHSPPIHPIITK